MQKKEFHIAIVSTNKDKYSETFIHNHVKLLPANVHFLFGGYFPKKYSTDGGRTEHAFVSSFFFYLKKFFSKKEVEEKQFLRASVEHYLVKNNIQLLFCEYGPSGVEMMDVASKLKMPLLVHFHGYDAYRNDVLSSYGKFYPQMFGIARAMIVVSVNMRKQLIKLGAPADKLTVLPNGIDLNIFKNQNRIKKENTFVYCGRFIEKKSPLTIIRAFSKVLDVNPEVNLVMIGDGDLLEPSRSLVNELGLQSAVEFKGVLKQQEIAEILNSSLVFVQHAITTALNDSEGTPMVILEAGACGLPVISTRHGGIPDVIIDGETGFLLAENDEQGLVEKMLVLANEPGLAMRLGKNAEKRIIEHYGMDGYIGRLFNLIVRQVDSR